MNAQQMLDAARKSNPGRTFGASRHDAVRVTYDRPLRRYEVGTDATLLYIGPRAGALRCVDAIMAGCYTPDTYIAWINTH